MRSFINNLGLLFLFFSFSHCADVSCPESITINTPTGSFPTDGPAFFPANYRCTIEFKIPTGKYVEIGTRNNLKYGGLTNDTLIIQDAASTQYRYYVLDKVFYAPADVAKLFITTYSITSNFYITWKYLDVTGFKKNQYPTGTILSMNLTANNYYQFTSPKSQVAFHTGSIGGDNDLSIYRIYVYDGDDLNAKFLGNLYQFTLTDMVSSGKSLTLVNYFNTTLHSYGIANDYSAISNYDGYGFVVLSSYIDYFMHGKSVAGKETVVTVFCTDCRFAYLNYISFLNSSDAGQEVRVRPMTPTDGYYANLLTYNVQRPTNTSLPQQIATNLFTLSLYQAEAYVGIITRSQGWSNGAPGRTGTIISPSLWSPKTVLTDSYFTNITTSSTSRFVFNINAKNTGDKVAMGTYMSISFTGSTSASSFIMDFSIEESIETSTKASASLITFSVMKFFLAFAIMAIIVGILSADGGCGENEIFNECGSPCDKTCADPVPTCIEMCKARCECRPGFVIHPTTKKCVNLKNCPK
ncbi:hypothetical protein L3Y34_005893 [Caenorhabditis briggsae]|uniref:CUB-like domain-containing protein n=1 Tax=Caenorhabditis briggsae TaxID=6238 RepID=A0AAE8ZWE2_CAEBR|nr:hypothetical protein L3Y34_005893 [Caenorhabditis briggsae]